MAKILIIEDERPLREEILELLCLENFQVIEAEHGRDGIALAREHQPDLILCDVMMPELDGYGVLEMLRQDLMTAMIPFIFITARAEKADLRYGMVLGADDYLIKPFSRVELLEAIATRFTKQETIERKHQQQLDELRGNITLSLPHELHTPLSGIICMSELLIAEYGSIDPLEGLEMLKTIHISGERLYRLTQNFLLYAELELIASNPKRIIALQNHGMKSAVHSIVSYIAHQKAEQADRSPDLQIDLRGMTVSIPESRLRKIAEEVLDNAFKFSEIGTPVFVVTYLDHHMAGFEVIDQGRGMTAAQITKVGAYMQFERKLYEQQGSGLGLILAKRLTELYGGELTIYSTLGERTLVRVVFPKDE
jgi:two-component system, sensor histidine kinase and response regulator